MLLCYLFFNVRYKHKAPTIHLDPLMRRGYKLVVPCFYCQFYYLVGSLGVGSQYLWFHFKIYDLFYVVREPYIDE